MIKAAGIALIWVCFSSLAFAQSAQESRGLEEEKRNLLTYTEVHTPLAASSVLPEDASSDLKFLKELYDRPLASVADGERVVTILNGNESGGDVSAQGDRLSKGAAALLFCRALGINGGIGLRLFPKSERYALRELVYEGLMSAEGPEELVTGRELVAMFVAAVDYMEKRRGRP